MRPDEWQREFCLANEDLVLMVCPRQSGKSTATAALACSTICHERNADVLLMAPSLPKAQELHLKIVRQFEALAPPTLAIKSQTSRSLTLSNGSRSICVPGTEKGPRGFTPMLAILDESAWIVDEAFHALSAAFGASKGRMICISTPNGQRGWFAQAWANDPDWKKIPIKARDVSRFSEDYLARQMRILGPELYAQEFDGQFLAADSGKNPLVFGTPATEALIDRIFS